MFGRFFVAAILLCFSAVAAVAQSCGGGLPYTFTEGQTASASQVNADFTYIMNCGANGSVGMLRAQMQQTSSTTAAFTADQVNVQTSLGGTTYPVPSVSATINISTTGANGMDVGSAPTSGDLSIYLIYNPTTASAALLGTSGTTSNGSVYAGSHMPSGYTASALVSSLKTNSSAQLNQFFQRDRTINFPAVSVISGASSTSYAAISIVTAVPSNAVSASGYMNQAGGNGIAVAGDVYGSGLQDQAGAGSYATAPFADIRLRTAQTLYYSVTGGTAGQILVSGYKF